MNLCLRPATPLAVVIKRNVSGNLEQPAGQLVLGRCRNRRPADPEKHLLSQIARDLTLARRTAEIPSMRSSTAQKSVSASVTEDMCVICRNDRQSRSSRREYPVTRAGDGGRPEGRSTGVERGVVRRPKVAASAGWAVSTFWRWTRTARGSGAPGTLCLRLQPSRWQYLTGSFAGAPKLICHALAVVAIVRRNWFALVGALEPTSARCPFGQAALSAVLC